MKTICDLNKGDVVWSYDHGKVRTRTVEYAYMGEDTTGKWHWCVKLSRCKPREIFCGGTGKDQAQDYLMKRYGHTGCYWNGYQMVWTDKDEFMKWLEKVASGHRRCYAKHNRLAQMFKSALDNMTNAMILYR